MKITQRCPSSFLIKNEDLIRAEVFTLEEFYAVPYIQSWAKTDNFYRFSMDRTHRPQALLLCEFHGRGPSVMAFLTEHEGFDLPIHKKKE